MNERVYLDWNATAPLRGEARAAMLAALDVVGNPSSVHAEGRAARRIVEDAREAVAALVGAAPRDVVFTSGGTEANMLGLAPGVAKSSNARGATVLFVSAIEHASVLSGGRFPKDRVEFVPVKADGTIDLQALTAGLTRATAAGEVPLVSLMHANNETGVVQPVSTAAELVHAAGGLLHVDTVQSAGKIACDLDLLGADLVSLSAHKLGGPKGVGALVKRSAALEVPALLSGGGQERGHRAGTENVVGIAGFGAAAATARQGLAETGLKIAALRDALETRLKALASDLVVFGAAAERLPNTSLVATPGMKAETALIALDLAGVAVSSGSACSSGKVAASHVLAAMGVAPALAACAVRMSLGSTTTDRDIDAVVGAWNTVLRRLSRGGSGIAA